MFAWFGVWTVVGLLAIYAWLWQVMGRETIAVHGQTFKIRCDTGGFGFDKAYDLPQMHDLRVAPIGFNPSDFSTALQSWGIGGGVIAFESGGKPRRFGAGLEEAEAKQVVEALKRRLRIAERLPK